MPKKAELNDFLKETFSDAEIEKIEVILKAARGVKALKYIDTKRQKKEA